MAAEDNPISGPSLTPGTAAGKAERAERLAAEMRKNLIKRKQQQRRLEETRRDQQEPGGTD